MSELLGRKVTVEIDNTVVATGRTKTLNIGNTAVDVTSDTDAGIHRVLDEPGEKQWNFNMDGMFDAAQTELLDKALDTTNGGATITLEYPSFSLSGSGFMESFELGKPYNEAITFSTAFIGQDELTKTTPQ